MRKIFIIIGLMLLNIGYVSSQNANSVRVTDTTHMDAHNRFYVSLYGGLAQFYGDVSSDVFFPGSMMKGKIPWSVSPRIGWDFNPRFGLRADLNVNSIWAQSNKGQDIYFHASVYDIQGEFMMNLTNIMFPYDYDKRWNMSLFLGAGWMFYNSIARNSADSIYTDALVGYDVNGNTTKRASDRLWSAGFSAGYKIAKHLDLSLEVKFNNTPTDKLDGISHALSEYDNYSSVMLGLTYYFGSKDQEWKWNPIDPFFEEIMDSIGANDNNIVDLGNEVSNLKGCCEGINPNATGEDDDGDGVPNVRDLEPKTPKGALVNWQGRTILPNDTTNAPSLDPQDFLDDDGDGVANVRDLEPNTPKGAIVNWQGKAVSGMGQSSVVNDPNKPTPVVNQPRATTQVVGMYFNSVYFPFDQSVVDQANYQEIIKLVMYLKANPGTRVKISGNTDVRGSNAYNDALSDRRVKAVKKILLEDFGFTEDIFVEEALGENKVFSNNTHWVNRRVDFFIVN